MRKRHLGDGQHGRALGGLAEIVRSRRARLVSFNIRLRLLGELPRFTNEGHQLAPVGHGLSGSPAMAIVTVAETARGA